MRQRGMQRIRMPERRAEGHRPAAFDELAREHGEVLRGDDLLEAMAVGLEPLGLVLATADLGPLLLPFSALPVRTRFLLMHVDSGPLREANYFRTVDEPAAILGPGWRLPSAGSGTMTPVP